MPNPVVGMIGGSVLQAGAASKAARAQSRAADAQVALQREIYNDQKGLFKPFYNSGTNALSALNFELGLGERPANYTGYDKTPGYDFRLNEGLGAVQSSAAARGSLNSGATLRDLLKYGQDYASQEYNNYLTRLGGMTDMGAAAAGNTANAGSNFASGVSNALGQKGNAQAAGAIGVGSAFNSGINNYLGYMQYNNTLKALG